ncbi:MAG: class I SAM-dependent methyltransferase [Clostridia bacterium]|nr:class I SAM-dependent methyltransferase [Clostridia bacterium]
MNDMQKNIREYWYAWIYDREEDVSEIAAHLVRELGDRPLRVLEAACGGGKLSVPLAEAGHDVTGFDRDEHMLRHAAARAENLPNLHIRRADLLTEAWGSGYDAVILGANLMVNLVTDRDYKRAQKNLLDRAYDALKPGGVLLMDYDCPLDVAKWTPANREWVCFEGTDDRGTYGRYIVVNGPVNNSTRTVSGKRRWEMKPADGEAFTVVTDSYKHFPTLEETCAWLYRIGLTIEAVRGGYNGEPFDKDHRRAVIRARKMPV